MINFYWQCGQKDLFEIQILRAASVGFQNKFNPIIKYLKNEIKKRYKDIIRVNFFNGESIIKFHEYENYKVSYAAKKKLGAFREAGQSPMPAGDRGYRLNRGCPGCSPVGTINMRPAKHSEQGTGGLQ